MSHEAVKFRKGKGQLASCPFPKSWLRRQDSNLQPSGYALSHAFAQGRTISSTSPQREVAGRCSGFYRQRASSTPSLCTFLPTSKALRQASLRIAMPKRWCFGLGSPEFTQFFNHSRLWKLQPRSELLRAVLQPDALPLSYCGKSVQETRTLFIAKASMIVKKRARLKLRSRFVRRERQSASAAFTTGHNSSSKGKTAGGRAFS